MQVRYAEFSDLVPATQMLIDSYNTTEYSQHNAKPDAESVASAVIGMIDNPTAVVLLATTDDGEPIGIAGAVGHQLWLNLSHTIAQELFWYVAPDHRRSRAGKMLMEGLDTWSRAIGADTLCVASVRSKHQNRINQIFEKQGFTRTETLFTKEL